MTIIFVPTSVFHHEEIRQAGQTAFISQIKESGGDGIEIRHELFSGEPQLKSMKKAIQKAGLYTIYSAPECVWTANGHLNRTSLISMMDMAHQIGAAKLKLPLGHYIENESDINELKNCLGEIEAKGSLVTLLIENDQTPYGGVIEPLRQFFSKAKQSKIPVEMAFDTGNWMWAGENVIEACRTLKDYVGYLHIKGVEKVNGELLTVPITFDKTAEWRHCLTYFPGNIPRTIEFPVEIDKLQPDMPLH
ncbi:sugar phosphate isomerase/epimerase [Scopulibacillus darangshiensis]|uniref:Sugar phosphate isomerase/epimerase n=1 Tax=Scopulibacillus darangshiensis TaxID=442528 RepID=A0A4R2NLB3_9BACL|nr:TIM barrel protein [Scopulibacillus darangshiensis]TCP22128.1 sugar phosphate isomerase/epimerase [Scopulibacillus darangshiensis]